MKSAGSIFKGDLQAVPELRSPTYNQPVLKKDTSPPPPRPSPVSLLYLKYELHALVPNNTWALLCARTKTLPSAAVHLIP